MTRCRFIFTIVIEVVTFRTAERRDRGGPADVRPGRSSAWGSPRRWCSEVGPTAWPEQARCAPGTVYGAVLASSLAVPGKPTLFTPTNSHPSGSSR